MEIKDTAQYFKVLAQKKSYEKFSRLGKCLYYPTVMGGAAAFLSLAYESNRNPDFTQTHTNLIFADVALVGIAVVTNLCVTGRQSDRKDAIHEYEFERFSDIAASEDGEELAWITDVIDPPAEDE